MNSQICVWVMHFKHRISTIDTHPSLDLTIKSPARPSSAVCPSINLTDVVLVRTIDNFLGMYKFVIISTNNKRQRHPRTCIHQNLTTAKYLVWHKIINEFLKWYHYSNSS